MTSLNTASAHMTPAERVQRGKDARKIAPLAAHADLPLAAGRDPVAPVSGDDADRVPELLPIRYGRMLVSPLTFYRGAAAVMAADLAGTPVTGLRAQTCGDAHLSNFGVFASAERALVFDLNDFDETLPGPWEWDVKRLAASLAVAGRVNGFTAKERRQAVTAAVSAYQRAMRDFAEQSNLAVWYAQLSDAAVLARVRRSLAPDQVKRTRRALEKARTQDSRLALNKMSGLDGDRRRITAVPPLVVPIEDLFTAGSTDQLYAEMHGLIDGYGRSLAPDRRRLLAQFRLVHLARKVVGVGSVGTRCWVLLLLGRDENDPLLLQAKQAGPSVLEGYAGKSEFTHHGERVVAGQRTMQASGDIFLGTHRVRGEDGVDRDYYLRQLRDWKGSIDVDRMIPTGMVEYGGLCGWTLARAHARSGDRIAIAAYLGSSDRFTQAVAAFAEAYADLNERDYQLLDQAVRDGRLPRQDGI